MENTLYPNSFQVNNFYVDKCLHLLDGNETKVLLYVIRRIIGFNKNFDFISLGQLENGIVTQSGERLDSGTGLSKPSIIKALSGLKKYGILLEVQKSQSPKLGSAYTLQFNYDKIDLINLEKRELDKGRNTSKKDLLVKDIYQSKPFTSKNRLLVDQPKNSQKSVDLLVNGFYTQNSDKNKNKKEEEKEIGISLSLNACSFDSASTFLGSDKVEEFSTSKATLKSETQKPENPNNPNNPKKDEQQARTIQPKSEPSKPTKQKNPPDPRSKHVAIVAVREIIGRFPDKLIWDEIIQALGESPDLEQLKFCAREWAKKTTNMGNLSTWLFDWYVNGLPLSTYQGQVLNHTQTQTQAQTQAQSQNARTELTVNSPTQLVQSRQFQQPIIHNKAIQTQNFNDAVFDTIRKQMKG